LILKQAGFIIADCVTIAGAFMNKRLSAMRGRELHLGKNVLAKWRTVYKLRLPRKEETWEKPKNLSKANLKREEREDIFPDYYALPDHSSFVDGK